MTADIDRYRNNLRDEMNGAALYAALAAAEPDPLRKDLFQQLAAAEMSHAQLWRDKLVASGLFGEPFAAEFCARLPMKPTPPFAPPLLSPPIAAAGCCGCNTNTGQ